MNNFIESKELEILAEQYKIKNGEINNFEELKDSISREEENIISIFGSLYFLGYILENYVED